MARVSVSRMVLAAVVLALIAPTAARADAGAQIVRQCLNTGAVSGNYSQQAYSQALRELPADVTEYSNCPDLIRRAQLAAAHGGSGSLAGGGAPPGAAGAATNGTPATFTPAEKAALAAAQHPGGPAGSVNVGGRYVQPGLVPVSVASALNRLPLSLLVLLAVLSAAALLGLGRLLLRRVSARGPS